MNGRDLPSLRTAIPGPASRSHIDRLARHECPAITARRSRRAVQLGAEHDDPIVWSEGRGANIKDVDGNVHVDLTSGFGVALAGHAHPDVVRATEAQLRALPHASGDAWPDASRIALLERLAAFAPGDLCVSLLGLSGSDAIDAAIKTARLATGRRGVLVFERGYHGLALGVLELQSVDRRFSDPFADPSSNWAHRLPFGGPLADIVRVLADHDIGLVLVEPIQGRGGFWPAPEGWLTELAAACRQGGALLAFDEIQTGCGRTGTRFAGPAEGVTPDLMCIGKALGGGFPVSACIGSEQTMAAWQPSTGQAIHTQTFLGHPVGCAAALAMLDLLEGDLLDRVQHVSDRLLGGLESHGWSCRGRGLMLAVELPENTSGMAAARALGRDGFICLPAGPNALQLTPPAVLTDEQLDAFVDALARVVRAA